MKKTITITRKNQNEGRRKAPFSCAVANAIDDHLTSPYKAAAHNSGQGRTRVGIYYSNDLEPVHEAVIDQGLALEFDCGRDLAGRSFEVEIPDQFLAPRD